MSDGTETSSFGTPGRVSHDASKFYNSRLYEGIRGENEVDYVENRIPLGGARPPVLQIQRKNG